MEHPTFRPDHDERLARARLAVEGLSLGDAFGQQFFYRESWADAVGLSGGLPRAVTDGGRHEGPLVVRPGASAGGGAVCLHSAADDAPQFSPERHPLARHALPAVRAAGEQG